MMTVTPTEIPEVLLLTPKVHNDYRGYFVETYNRRNTEAALEEIEFVQDNESFSHFGTLRGLHFQNAPEAQAKLVRVIDGEVYDVAVDIRKNSPSYGQYVGAYLSGENKNQLFIPRGFAHGYLVLSETAIFAYKCDNYYSPDCGAGILWSDPTIGIDWPLSSDQIILSEKDKNQPFLSEAKIIF